MKTGIDDFRCQKLKSIEAVSSSFVYVLTSMVACCDVVGHAGFGFGWFGIFTGDLQACGSECQLWIVDRQGWQQYP